MKAIKALGSITCRAEGLLRLLGSIRAIKALWLYYRWRARVGLRLNAAQEAG
jgi:hypothetical protein